MESDIQWILQDLRDTPDSELVTEPALKSALKQSVNAWVGEIDGQPVAMWGIYRGSLIDPTGFLWMVTTNAVEEHQFTFVRYARIVLDILLERCKYVYATVNPGFTRSQKFLRFLKFTAETPVNVDGKTLLVYKRRR